jgi:hypothetical protein
MKENHSTMDDNNYARNTGGIDSMLHKPKLETSAGSSRSRALSSLQPKETFRASVVRYSIKTYMVRNLVIENPLCLAARPDRSCVRQIGAFESTNKSNVRNLRVYLIELLRGQAASSDTFIASKRDPRWAYSHCSLTLLIDDDFPAVHFNVIARSRLLDVNALAV